MAPTSTPVLKRLLTMIADAHSSGAASTLRVNRDALASPSCTWPTTGTRRTQASRIQSGCRTVFAYSTSGRTSRSRRRPAGTERTTCHARRTRPRGLSRPLRSTGVSQRRTSAPTASSASTSGPARGHRDDDPPPRLAHRRGALDRHPRGPVQVGRRVGDEDRRAHAALSKDLRCRATRAAGSS